MKTVDVNAVFLRIVICNGTLTGNFNTSCSRLDILSSQEVAGKWSSADFRDQVQE